MAENPIWTDADCGCYADGANGDAHRRDVLVGLLAEVEAAAIDEHGSPGSPIAAKIVELQEELVEGGEFVADAEDDAIEYLNGYAEGVYFAMEAGDLILFSVLEEDGYGDMVP